MIPGGRSKPYYDSLGKDGNKRITHFVDSGGGFLGICAGAYYASDKIEFELGTKSEIVLDGGLNFFQGKAKGPAYGHGKYSNYTLRGVEAAPISWTSQEPLVSGNQGFVYYNGGCSFSPHTDNRFKTLARYTELSDSPIAAIEGRVRKGIVVLTGVHFEVNASLLQFYPGNHLSWDCVNKMIRSENYQHAVLSSILTRLGFTNKYFSTEPTFFDTQKNSSDLNPPGHHYV